MTSDLNTNAQYSLGGDSRRRGLQHGGKIYISSLFHRHREFHKQSELPFSFRESQVSINPHLMIAQNQLGEGEENKRSAVSHLFECEGAEIRYVDSFV